MQDENKTIVLIRQYKELLDAGAITQEEYDRKKAELLSYDPFREEPNNDEYEPFDKDATGYDEPPAEYTQTGRKKIGCLPRIAIWTGLGAVAFLIVLFIIGVTIGGADAFTGKRTGQAEVTQPTESDDYNVEPAAQPTGNILLDAEVQIADVMTGDGSEKIGEYAYITITREQAQALTEDEYTAFLSERVKGGGYNWFTVVLDDGTGVIYPGSGIYSGVYGQLAADKTVEKELGYITFDGEKVTYDKAE